VEDLHAETMEILGITALAGLAAAVPSVDRFTALDEAAAWVHPAVPRRSNRGRAPLRWFEVPHRGAPLYCGLG
jgi:hypothetical protein